ncbi:MAG: ribbon-helix-helix domain-containing protein [Desulfobacterales bacterium]|jgi:predicted transcriptional regulator
MGSKKTFSTRIDDDRLKALKHLAVDTDKSLGTLLEEAIEDLIKKYKKKKN